MFNVLGAGISALAGLAGARISAGAAQDANKSNAALNRETRQWQTGQNAKARRFARGQAAQDRATQRRFAKHGPQWQMRSLIAGAKEAGIHPLAALGGGAPAYSPAAGSPPMGGVNPAPYAAAPDFTGSAIGEGVSSVISAFETEQRQRLASEAADADVRLRTQVAGADMRRLEAETTLIQAQTAAVLAQAEAAARGGTRGGPVGAENPVVERDAAPVMREVVLPDGRRVTIPANVADPEEYIGALIAQIQAELQGDDQNHPRGHRANTQRPQRGGLVMPWERRGNPNPQRRTGQ